MRKLLMMIAALAMTTIFAQANTMEKAEEAAAQTKQDTAITASVAQTDETPAPKDDKNDSEQGTQEEK